MFAVKDKMEFGDMGNLTIERGELNGGQRRCICIHDLI